MLEKLLDRFREKGPSQPRSKMEAEKRRRLFIVLVIVVAVVTAVSIVGYGYYDTSVRPWNQRILKVNGTAIEMRAFVKTMRTWTLLYQIYYGSTITPSSELAQSVATSMQENELKRQELEGTYGIQIDEDAVDERFREMLVSEDATDEEFNEQYDVWKTNLKTYGLTIGDFKELYIKPLVISEELQKLVGDGEYPADSLVEHAQVQALLVLGADDAAQLRARWEAGERFDTLSEEESVSESLKDVSTDNGTSEWVAKGIKSTAFDGFVFSATPGMLSDPIQDTDSTGSYWLTTVVARESRTLSESDRDLLVGEAYSQWLEEVLASEDNDIVNYLDEESGEAKLSWALDHVAVGD
ncbi:MAG: SurA N-terminal domain-containing protein [Dehalococcoidia bacterium]|nr:SurA N-terminal domain-containing protein [Dehalococcoidia bacterium]